MAGHNSVFTTICLGWHGKAGTTHRAPTKNLSMVSIITVRKEYLYGEETVRTHYYPY